jgi:integrase
MTIHRIQEGKIERLMRTKGKHPDGGGLYLQVASANQASWVWRHKERWKSIGPASLYTITEARHKAHELRRAVHEGRDPFQMLASIRPEPAGKTFAEAMAEYLKAKSPTWAASNRDRELRRYAFLFGQVPDFTALPLKAIDQHAKNAALATWPLGSKQRRDVSFYVEAIIRYAETGKLRLKTNGKSVEHHESMPYADVPGFYRRLGEVGSVDARALQFVILTGARTDEVIGAKRKAKWTKHPATWREIEEVDGLPVWVIPGERMKGGKQHRVPLSAETLVLLGERRADNTPLFKVSSANAMLNTLKANGGDGFTVHGFRTSFTEWAAHETDHPEDLADRCISHERRTKVRRAYQRSDLLDKRREIMTGWSDYVTLALLHK